MVDKDEVLGRLTPQDVYGVNLSKTTRGYKMLCPFHEETIPSFMIDASTLKFRCWGCNEFGDAIKFVELRDKVDFLTALKTLADIVGLDIEKGTSKFARLYEINRKAQAIYSQHLMSNDQVLSYLMETRGITRESIEKFGLGYINNSPVVSALKEKGYSDDEMVSAGIAVKKEGHVRDFLWKRIIFPIVSGSRTVGFGGRVIDGSDPKYINTPATPIFRKKELLYGLNGYAISEKGFAIVQEGYFDVIISHQYGHLNTVAPLGIALTEEHIAALKKYSDTVVLIFDGDSAGRAAAKRSVKLLFDSKLQGSVAILPAGEDPDTFLRSGNSLDALIEESTPFSVFLARAFPAHRKMIFNALLKRRRPLETAEFLSHMGSAQEQQYFMEFNARVYIDAVIYAESTLVVRRKGIEVRKYHQDLLLFSHKRFLWHKRIKGDEKRQADDMMKSVIGIRKIREKNESR